MEQNKPPSLAEQIKSLGTAVTNWTVKDGLKVVSPEILEIRKKLCFECEFWDKDAFAGVGRCKICGCSLAKLYIPSSSCPLPSPKWRAITYADKSSDGPAVFKEGIRPPLRVIRKEESNISGSASQ